MSGPKKPQKYRDIIDALVDVCQEGEGQIAAERVREGVWHKWPNAENESLREEHEINLLLKRLSAKDRKILAKMLEQEVVTGVFETLKTLEEFEVPPFEDGYEGSPYNDFIGRLDDWKWPRKK